MPRHCFFIRLQTTSTAEHSGVHGSRNAPSALGHLSSLLERPRVPTKQRLRMPVRVVAKTSTPPRRRFLRTMMVRKVEQALLPIASPRTREASLSPPPRQMTLSTPLLVSQPNL